MNIINDNDPHVASIQLLAIELIHELLASTVSGKLPEVLTAQLRELSGARTVLLVEHIDEDAHSTHRLVGISPERRSSLFNTQDLQALCPSCQAIRMESTEISVVSEQIALDSYNIIETAVEAPPNIRAIMEEKGIASLLRFPLRSAGRLLGSLCLMDLPESERCSDVYTGLQPIIPAISMAVMNALNQEKILEQSALLEDKASLLEALVKKRSFGLRAANARLKRLLEEKEILLREINHRTKNTLEIIRSILVLQAREYADNDGVMEMVSNAEKRIMAISLVYKRLHNTKDVSLLKIADYFSELSSLVFQAFDTNLGRIQLSSDLVDEVVLFDVAVPLGLLFNELLMNSLKYAFPDNREGSIYYSFSEADTEHWRFLYKDTGIGIVQEAFDWRQTTSLGFQLVQALGEGQLQGKAIVNGSNGFSCELVFPKAIYRKRV